MTIVCFDKHREDRRVAAVRHEGKWTEAVEVQLEAPARTVYRGKGARQPVFYFEVLVPVRLSWPRRGVLRIRPA